MQQRAMTRTVSKKVKRFLWAPESGEWNGKLIKIIAKKKLLVRRTKCVRDQKIYLANIFGI